MHRRNNPGFWVLFLSVVLLGIPASQGQANQSSQDQKVQPTPLPPDVDPSDPALPVWARPAKPTPPKAANTQPGANQPANRGAAAAGNVPSGQTAQASPQQPKVGQVTQDNGRFTYRQQVEEVHLTATVVDQHQHLVTTLQQGDFTIYDNDQPQQVVRFSREDIPVSLGILVDNSGSMRDKRSKVAKAVLNLIQASNPQDEVFVVNFNDDAYLDQDFTSNVGLLKEALDRLDTRGGTALYDAMIAAADHLAKGGTRQKKVLLVVTDGEDDASTNSLEQAIRSVQSDNGPTIYTIGILGSNGKERRARRYLENVSIQTGGVAFFPTDLNQVDEISQEVARDIRNQYSISYKPNNAAPGWHSVKVVAKAPGYKGLEVRTRSGYYPGQQQQAANSPQQQEQQPQQPRQ